MRVRRYLVNVLWSWGAVATNIVVAFFLSAYVIRVIGDTDFSIWTLTLSFVDYYWLIDLGFRSATIKMSAEYQAVKDTEKLSRLLNTALLYATLAGAVVLGFSHLIAPYAGGWFHIDHPYFPGLVRIVGTSWALGMTFNVLGAFLEGYQRFDLLSRIWVVTTIVRSIGIAWLVSHGFGLLEMGWTMLGAQTLMYLMTYFSFRGICPDLRMTWRPHTPTLKAMLSYGSHSLTTLVASRLITQSVPLLIAYFLPVRFVAYYTVPVRILEYASDGIGRMGMVTAPTATELMARKEKSDLLKLGVYANRYSLAMYLPVTIFLLVYRLELFGLWIRPDFAVQCAELVAILLMGHTALAGQYNSVSILFGMGRHRTYSRRFLIEGLALIAGLGIVLPRFGLTGAAWVAGTLMLLNRAIGTCWLVSKELEVNPAVYAWRIYAKPLAAGAVTTAVLFLCKQYLLPGRSWGELVGAATVMMLVYGSLGFVVLLDAGHQQALLSRLRGVLSKT